MATILPSRQTISKPAIPEPTPVNGRVPGGFILLVEDDPDVVEMLQTVLSTRGRQVLTAANGLEALNQFVRYAEAIGVVLTDLKMPILDGMELIRALRTLAPEVEIVVSTAADLKEPGTLQRLRALGVSEILPKPYTTQRLFTVLDTALRDSL